MAALPILLTLEYFTPRRFGSAGLGLTRLGMLLTCLFCFLVCLLTCCLIIGNGSGIGLRIRGFGRFRGRRGLDMLKGSELGMRTCGLVNFLGIQTQGLERREGFGGGGRVFGVFTFG